MEICISLQSRSSERISTVIFIGLGLGLCENKMVIQNFDGQQFECSDNSKYKQFVPTLSDTESCKMLLNFIKWNSFV